MKCPNCNAENENNSKFCTSCGSPIPQPTAQGSSYEDDPETGKTGFHYYSNFTVSTTVDENGNEIVAGIWQNRTTNVTEEVFRSSVTCDKINFRRQLL